MSLYVCEKGQNIENTALAHYWGGSRLCSACDPQIGKWHGRFEQTKFNPERDEIMDGFVVRT